MQNYLELQRLRRNDAKINYELKGRARDLTIAPFLFIPFALAGLNTDGDDGDAFVLVDVDHLFEYLTDHNKKALSIQYGDGPKTRAYIYEPGICNLGSEFERSAWL